MKPKEFSIAPDFELNDVHGRSVRLSDFRGRNVILAFLRGFHCPYCRSQLRNLRDEYGAFQAREAEILAVGPDDLKTFKNIWTENDLPFIGLPDPGHIVADQYKQEVRLLKLGRMPAVMLIDRQGQVRFQHYGGSMADIPENAFLLRLLDMINGKSPGPEPVKEPVT
ncbi:MAG: redoxin domain-containing protein [Anaerolineales bacterium]|nr:redoxin domain-containing protein [Anaerolineales bacterium]